MRSGFSTLALCFAMTAAAVPVAWAQDGALGVYGGAAVTGFSGAEDHVEVRNRVGWTAGAFAVVGLTDALALQPEIAYTEKGAREVIPLAGERLERGYRARYLELPMLLRYRLPFDLPISPWLATGPAPAYVFDARNAVGGLVEDMTNQMRRFDLGLVLGIGTDVHLRFGTVRLDARYTAGLLDVDATGSGGPNRNQSFTATFGFALPVRLGL